MSNRAYYSTQSGFRKGYPCQTALITLHNLVLEKATHVKSRLLLYTIWF